MDLGVGVGLATGAPSGFLFVFILSSSLSFVVALSPSVLVPLRVDFVTSNDPCSFTLLFATLRPYTAGEKPLSREAGNLPPPSADGGALSVRHRLKDARRDAASAGSVQTAVLQSPRMRGFPFSPEGAAWCKRLC